MLFESPGPRVLDFPDNVTTSPRGTLILCEDGTNDNYLRGLTPQGELFDIAQNRLTASSARRPAQRRVRRVHVQPDGRTLFVNIQASQRHDVRDLGTLGTHRRLSDRNRRGGVPGLPARRLVPGCRA